MFTVSQIATVLGGRLVGADRGIEIGGVSIDTRSIQAGDLFVALRGAKVDGHSYVANAFRQGAIGALVEHLCEGQGPQIVVPNAMEALQALARWYRKLFDLSVVGITGSAGKTTAKECLGLLLSFGAKTMVGHANWNNHLGVPLNILRIKEKDEFLVLELGANHPGEISFLCGIAQPTLGIVTSVYPVHLEGFGSMEGIYEAKLELADYLRASSGTLLVNGDDPELVRRAQARGVRVLTFGSKGECDYVLSKVNSGKGRISFQVNGKYDFELAGNGAFNASNATAAIAAANILGSDLKELCSRWKELPLIPGRFRVRRWEAEGIVLVDDAYNANPCSFAASLDAFDELARDGGGKRKIVVAGAMLELGEEAAKYHKALGKRLCDSDVDLLIGVGDLSRHTVAAYEKSGDKGRAVFFENYGKTIEFLLPIISSGDRILVKGSHGICLNYLVQEIEKKFDQPSILV